MLTRANRQVEILHHKITTRFEMGGIVKVITKRRVSSSDCIQPGW